LAAHRQRIAGPSRGAWPETHALVARALGLLLVVWNRVEFRASSWPDWVSWHDALVGSPPATQVAACLGRAQDVTQCLPCACICHRCTASEAWGCV
jgi:hypothetical protein